MLLVLCAHANEAKFHEHFCRSYENTTTMQSTYLTDHRGKNHSVFISPAQKGEIPLRIVAPRISQCISLAQSNPEEVVFPMGGRELHGFIWKPEGTGPFPAIVWNHGSEKWPGSHPVLAKFYTAHSYVFFVPHRRGQGRSPGNYIQDLLAQAPPSERARRMVELQQDEVDDVIAALNYLRSRPLVDPSRIAISGCSYGGIQTLLVGERDLGERRSCRSLRVQCRGSKMCRFKIA